MFKEIYEIITARKFQYVDADVGLLKRVGGYWRIESPPRTLGVSVKIYGSDRFGPNRKSLSVYKLRRNDFERLWMDSINGIIEQSRDENGQVRFQEGEFELNEIIFGPPNDRGIEFAYAFNIASAPNEYGANIKSGEYFEYYSLYG